MSIELKNVSYTYMPGTPMERQALMGVNMTLERGRFYAIAGHTGSGKSTLIQQICGLLTPTSGEVVVEGVPLKPDPTGAQLILDQIGITNEECWYVGDTSMDMNCGNAAQMETVGVLWGFRPREELVASGAKHLIAEPRELLDLVDAQINR